MHAHSSHAHDHDHPRDHAQGNDHAHAAGHAHAHGVARDADRRYLTVALLLLLGFMIVEVVVGILARSLALISDAGHMLTDVAAIALALVAMRLASRPASGSYTFGLKRVEILSAQANGVTLLLLSVWFVVEAVRRLIHPPAVHGLLVTVVAVAGIGVNLLAVWAMHKANRESLNIEGSYQHVLTDLYAFIATAVAGVLVWWTGWSRFDSLAALVVAALMLKAGVGLVRDAGRVFLEAAPRGLEPDTIARAMHALPAVTRVDDLHVWEVTSGMPALSAHVFVEPDVDCHDVRRELETLLRDRFAISHTTIQTDHAASGQAVATPCSLDAHGAGHCP
ncbi:MAG: cation diffusion facilitator family transporter [Rhodanobacter sp.]